jgi:hypothetical protein
VSQAADKLFLKIPEVKECEFLKTSTKCSFTRERLEKSRSVVFVSTWKQVIINDNLRSIFIQNSNLKVLNLALSLVFAVVHNVVVHRFSRQHSPLDLIKLIVSLYKELANAH